jgi:hypothetical protein
MKSIMSPPSAPAWRPANRGTALKETSKGLLYLEFSPGSVVGLRPTPAQAWNKREHRPTWRGTAFPSVHLGALIRHIRAERSINDGLSRKALPVKDRPPVRPYETRRRQNFARFLSEVPPAVEAELAHRYPSTDWPLFRLLLASPRAMETCHAGDRALVYSLTIARQFDHTASRRMLPFAETWLKKPRRQALARLGFPDRPLSASVLRKLDLSHADPGVLVALRHGLRHSEVAKALAHLPRINAGAALLVQPRLLPRLTPALLGEVAAIECRWRSGAVATLLSHTMQFEKELDVRSRPHFSSVVALRERHDALSERARLLALSSEEPFPDPPIELDEDEAEWARPLDHGAALVKEGTTMRHCLGTLREHHSLARQGRFYAWALHGTERATVALIRRKDAWRLYDVRGVANGPVSERLQSWARQLVLRARGWDVQPAEPLYDAHYDDDLPF